MTPLGFIIHQVESGEWTTVLNRAEKGYEAGIKQTWWQSHCECERDGGVG